MQRGTDRHTDIRGHYAFHFNYNVLCMSYSVKVKCGQRSFYSYSMQWTAEGSVFGAVSVWVFCFRVKYPWKHWIDLHQINTEEVFGSSLGRVWRSRSPGTKMAFFHHLGGLHAACLPLACSFKFKMLWCASNNCVSNLVTFSMTQADALPTNNVWSLIIYAKGASWMYCVIMM